MINIVNFDPNLLKIDKTLFKNIDIYYIGYITMKDSEYVKTKSINSLHLIISGVDEHFDEKNGNKYLILHSANKNKEVLKEYAELCGGIKNSIKKVNNK